VSNLSDLVFEQSESSDDNLIKKEMSKAAEIQREEGTE
jgi:hypothetical protein